MMTKSKCDRINSNLEQGGHRRFQRLAESRAYYQWGKLPCRSLDARKHVVGPTSRGG